MPRQYQETGTTVQGRIEGSDQAACRGAAEPHSGVHEFRHENARSLFGSGRFRFYHALIRLRSKYLIQNPGKATDHHFAGAGTLERHHAGIAGRTAGQYIVDQHDPRTFHHGTMAP